MVWRRNIIGVVAAVAAALTCIGSASAGRSAAPQWPYQVYRPAALSKTQQAPLLVVPSGNSALMISTTHLNQAADKDGFVVVYTQILKSYNDVVRAQGESVT